MAYSNSAPGSAAAKNNDVVTAQRVLRREIDALEALSDSLGEEFARAVEVIQSIKGRVVCAGIGKSGHVARKIAATMASTGTPAYFVHPTEASHGDLGMISADDVVLALSRSGETAELSDILQYAKRFRIPLIGMMAEEDSALGRASDIVLLLPDAGEACAETKAPTTSTTLMMALGDALAVALVERKGFKADDFKMFHPGGKLGAMLKTAGDLMHPATQLPLVESGMPLKAAVDRITEKGFGMAGVIDASGGLLGVITDGDIRRYVSGGKTVTIADEIMSTSPAVVQRNILAAGLLRTMNDRGITQVFVVEDGRPVGLVHMHDLLRAGVI